MESIKNLFSHKILILSIALVLFMIVFVGFAGWYYLSQKQIDEKSVNLVPKASQTTNSIDQDVSDVDKEMQSTSTEDFSDSQLNDNQVGLN
jgi:cytoskeletal protein RodZ